MTCRARHRRTQQRRAATTTSGDFDDSKKKRAARRSRSACESNEPEPAFFSARCLCCVWRLRAPPPPSSARSLVRSLACLHTHSFAAATRCRAAPFATPLGRRASASPLLTATRARSSSLVALAAAYHKHACTRSRPPSNERPHSNASLSQILLLHTREARPSHLLLSHSCQQPVAAVSKTY